MHDDALHVLGEASKLPDSYVMPYYLDDLRRRVSAVRVGGVVYAFDDLCPCGGTPCSLAAGQLQGTVLMCQCHGSVWEVTTGEVLRGPATAALRTYRAVERGDDVMAAIEV